MRVISGSARGRKLKEPQGFDIRPTSGMVKESVFNIIQFDIEGRRVLDLFAGTGQLGIEALSRGAKSAVFVDSHPDAIRLIKENIGICGFSDMAAVYARDALEFLKNDEKYDIIFLDPPYDSPLFSRALDRIIEFDKLFTNGIIISETKADSTTPVPAAPYFSQKEYKYGSVKITRYVRESDGNVEKY
jgi:16S rRNA (guanine(966)-N(2))-methyltransferase RsmD